MDIKNCYVIFNKNAGKNRAGKIAQKIADEIEKQMGIKSSLLEASSKEQDQSAISFIQNSPNTLLVMLGGDGTISSYMRAMICANKVVPIAIYPCGTANDFATSIKVPRNIKKFVMMLKSNEATLVDIAKAQNDYYAINAVGAGNFSNGVTVYNLKAKKFLGKFGYYFKCVREFFKMKSCILHFKTESEEFSAETLMYYLVNSKQAGGFKKLSTNASITDGKWDLLVVKKCGFFACLGVFFSILAGKAEKNKNIITKQVKSLIVTGGENHEKFYRSDVDGNAGPEGALSVKVLNAQLPVILNLENKPKK